MSWLQSFVDLSSYLIKAQSNPIAYIENSWKHEGFPGGNISWNFDRTQVRSILALKFCVMLLIIE